ncbi:MAG TPA: sigma-70 family RNA polymerase sigma factor [Candidatus Angelobacter sp.]
MAPLTGEVTRLLLDLRSGNEEAEARLFVLLHDELRRMAASRLRNERRDHTLQPTALVNEVYLRVVEQPHQNWENRTHFLRICSRIMRQILIDHARKRNADKRGGVEKPVSLDELAVAGTQRPEILLALDEALIRLETVDPRQGSVVVMRFYGGLSEEEISQVLGTSVRTIKRDWNVARAWLYAEMTK